MQNEHIQEVQKGKRLKLRLSDKIFHYLVVPFLLTVPALHVYSLFQIYVSHTYTGISTTSELILSASPWIVAAILSYSIQRRALKFREVKINHTGDDFKEAIEKTAEQLEWQIEKCTTYFARAYRPGNLTGSWGEMITIIRNDHSILINSICDPSQPSVTSWGWNKKNVNTFLTNLQEVVNGVHTPATIEDDLPANEWTFGRTVKRIFIYPFCVFMILMGVYMLINPTDARSFFSGPGLILLGSAYLYLDIKILRTRKKS